MGAVELRIHTPAEQGRRDNRRPNSPQDGRRAVSCRRERGEQDEGLEAHGAKRGRLDFKMDDITEATTMIAVQGPSAIQALQPLTPLPLAEMKRFTHAVSTVKGIGAVITRYWVHRRGRV